LSSRDDYLFAVHCVLDQLRELRFSRDQPTDRRPPGLSLLTIRLFTASRLVQRDSTLTAKLGSFLAFFAGRVSAA
jgi:hypothetical protein